MAKVLRMLLSAAIVLVAAGVVFFMYWDYVVNPWTRDGQVRAQVIQITPRVSGPIVNLAIRDNQLVKAGDLLFEIDPRTFRAAVDQAKADLGQADVQVDEARNEIERAERIKRQDPGAMSEQEIVRKQAELKRAEATGLGAEAALQQAELNLEFTKVTAPVDGYVTNLNLRLGSQAVTNQPALALIDINSFWIHGFFQENNIEGISEGDRAIVTLMTYPDRPLEGRVDSLGWGIAQQDGSPGFNLLPTIRPTFEWIRLAQRVPIRVHLTEVPNEVELRVGTTASVLVMTGTAGEAVDSPAVAAPRALQ